MSSRTSVVLLALVLFHCVSTAGAATWYAAASRPDDNGDGTTWGTAKKTIQAAVNLAASNDTVLVANGLYNIGTTITPGYSLHNRVVIVKPITVRGIDGPERTVIEGSGTNFFGTTSAIRCVFMSNGVLDGFTLRQGATYSSDQTSTAAYDQSGGGVNMYGAATSTTVSNCIMGNCRAYYGGGVAYGTAVECTLRQNSADIGGGSYYSTLGRCELTNNCATMGGGASVGTLDDCTLAGNSGGTGGGSWRSTLHRCVLKNNYGGNGGGAFEATLYNCILIRNSSDSQGGGAYGATLYSCTVVNNFARSGGGGAYKGTLNNCIVWNNVNFGNAVDNYAGGSSALYTCTFPLPAGTGNIQAEPLFVNIDDDDVRLHARSPCLNVGHNAYVVGTTDIAGAPRIQDGTVDMGAYEGGAESLLIEIKTSGMGAVSPGQTQVVQAGGEVAFTASPTVRPFVGFFTNGVFASSSTNWTWTNIVTDGLVIAAFQTFTLYVDASRPDDTGDGTTWATAKRTIQAAIDQALADETVLVADGIYSNGVRATPGNTLNNRIVITNDITVRSANGPATTIIEGSGTNFYGTASAIRCVFMTSGQLSGFTLRQGATANTSFSDNGNGGGVNMYGCREGTLVTNCVIRNCKSVVGGGAHFGSLTSCLIYDNVAIHGGGACSCILNNCVLSNNIVAEWGGGAISSTLNSCLVVGNYASSYGGGSHQGILNNCTVVGNIASRGGGGGFNSTFVNSIVWANILTNGVIDNYFNCSFQYSCSKLLPSGPGNIEAAPGFIDASSGDYRLRVDSPCVNGGDVGFVAGETDLAGGRRVQGDAVDMGAYEAAALPMPSFSSPSGTTFFSPLVVTIQCSVVGATLRYCTDGSDPVASSPIYTVPITLTNTTTVKAKAFMDGIVASEIAAATYVLLRVERPTITPASGLAATNPLAIQMSCSTTGATIRYTLDGLDPTAASTEYTGLFAVTVPVTLKARGFKAGMADSSVVTASYFLASVAAPVMTPPPGTAFTNVASVVITCDTLGAVVRYSLDGSEPTEFSPIYLTPLSLTTSTTIKAKAFKAGMAEGPTTVGIYRPAIWYHVDASRPDDSGDGLTWATAKKTIQAAVDVTIAGDTVLVTNGVYAIGAKQTPGLLHSNRVYITKPVFVRSVDGPATTIIEGSGTNLFGTTSAIRCVLMTDGVLDGFTLRYGTTPNSDSSGYPGGGISMNGAAAGTYITNCVIQYCKARSGGGSVYGELRNCRITSCAATYNGGGTYGSALGNCTVDGNTAANYGGGSYNAILHSCLLAGNSASSGGGAYLGALSNSTVTGNSASNQGGGSYNALLNGCLLTSNSASSGGGAYSGALSNSIVTGNSAGNQGGGTYSATLNRCDVRGNAAGSQGGAAYYGTLNNCAIAGNRAGSQGGGCYSVTLNNCTLFGNVANSGGGTSFGTCNNCIVWGNTSWGSDNNNYSGGSFNFCCTFPLVAGLGNMISDPQLLSAQNGDLRLRSASPCIGAGLNAYAVADIDLEGMPRIQNEFVDMGAYEGGVSGFIVHVGRVGCGTVAPSQDVVVAAGGTLAVTAKPASRPFMHFLVDGVVGGTSTNIVLGNVQKDVTLVAVFESVTFYVDKSRPDDGGDGSSWPTAKRTLQAGMDLAEDGDTLLVAPGVYDEGGAITPGGTLSNRLVVIRGARVRSTGGPALTVIRGHGIAGQPDSSRCVYMSDGFLEGFTLSAGATLNSSLGLDGMGAGVYMNKAGRSGSVSRCIIRDGVAYSGGGAAFGALSDCVLINNVAGNDGGGAYGSTLIGCTVVTNRGATAGTRFCTATNTVIWGNVRGDGTLVNNSVGSFAYCCSSPQPDGTGNIDLDPLFVAASNLDFRLLSSSPCANAGTTNGVDSALDLDGNHRIRGGLPDIGAYESAVLPMVSSPVIDPPDGATFASTLKVTMQCATEGAQIRYTLDGSDPTGASPLYTTAFNVTSSVTIKARAFKAEMQESLIVSVSYTKLPALAEAIDVTNLVVTTGGDASWGGQIAVTHDAIDAARSGVITNSQSTWMEVSVVGPGTASFWWKVSCEDDPDFNNWDYLRFLVDGAESNRVDGTTDWQQVTCVLTGGTHTLRWEYRKDATLSAGSDCGWVDQVAFTPTSGVPAQTSTPVPVPYSYLDLYPTLMAACGGNYETAAMADLDGDGHVTWQEYVTGSDPTNVNSVLLALIAFSNGTPAITWTPDLGGARLYEVQGVPGMTDPWGPTNGSSRFFRVRVSMP